MAFYYHNDPDELHWWQMIADHPELGEGLEELSGDPEASVVTAVGIFTMLKLRFWHRMPEAVSETPQQEHRSDDGLPPGAGGKSMNSL